MTFKSFSNLSVVGVALLTSTCMQPSQTSVSAGALSVRYIDTASFDSTIQGKPVKFYALKNGALRAAVCNYGARVLSLEIPDKSGKMVDVVLGYRNLRSYTQTGDGFYGSIVGRYGNRIANGKFSLHGQSYQLETNDGSNTLHGGTSGYYGKVWGVESVSDTALGLHYLSKDGEGGYPGNLSIHVMYTLHKDGLEINYWAGTDKTTVLNLTNHSYFNLSGEGDSSILDHRLFIDATGYTPVDSTLIPTGRVAPVANTPFDFRKQRAIGAHIGDKDEQLILGGGFDHNFVLRSMPGVRLAAKVQSPKTSIVLEVWTDQPGLQFYSGNFMRDVKNAKGGKVYGYRSAFCLETQHFPDSPNKPGFPTTVLNPGDAYRTTTIYKLKNE